MRERLADLREKDDVWCQGRSPLFRAPQLLWMAHVGIRHLFDSDYTSVIGALNLAIHARRVRGRARDPALGQKASDLRAWHGRRCPPKGAPQGSSTLIASSSTTTL